MRNIVLIGMPGSGKTTISKALGKVLHLPVIDIDEWIVDYYGMTISDMFEISEDYFRDHETEACRLLKEKQNVIISCGGGVVLREENIAYLKENGTIYLLNRDLEKIMESVDTSTRPLLKEGKNKLLKLYEVRWPLYLKSADVVIDNNGSIEQTIELLKKAFKLV